MQRCALVYLGELMAKKHDSVQLDRQELNLLILAAREGDDGAFSTLHSAYKGLLVSVVNSFSGKIPSDVYSPEDLMQECLMAFYRAVESKIFLEQHDSIRLWAQSCRIIERYWEGVIFVTVRKARINAVIEPKPAL